MLMFCLENLGEGLSRLASPLVYTTADLILGYVDVVVHAENAGMRNVRQTANIIEVRFIVAFRRRVVYVAIVVQVVVVIVDDVGAVELG